MTSDTLRCFIGVKIRPPEPLRRIVVHLTAMGCAFKAVDPNQLHLTLKFLGDVNRESLPAVQSIVESIAKATQRLNVSVFGVGVFPHLQRPSVVWAGLQGAEALASAATDLEWMLDPLGFAREKRSFVPHVTLARVKAKPPDSLKALVERESQTRFGAATIERIELLQSELGPDGARYTVLFAAELAGDR